MAKANQTGRTVGSSAPTTPAAATATNSTPSATETKDDGESGEGDSTAAPVVDPFADLPVVHAANYEVRDLTKVEKVGAPRKYAGVATKAAEVNSQMKLNWKYANAVFKIGSNKHEKRAGSVMRNIQDVTSGYGKEGVPAIVLVSRLRQLCVNNTRSHFCQGALPAVGWAEGYIDGAVNQGLIMKVGELDHELLPKVAAPAEEQTTAEPQAAAA